MIFLLFSIPNLSIMQNLPDPVYRNTTQFTNINSDYGARNFYGTGSVFHKGIDYAVPAYHNAYAVDDGSVSFQSLYNHNAKIITTHNNDVWRYIHILVGQRADSLWDFRQKLLSNGNYYYVLVQRERVNGALNTVKAITSVSCPSYITSFTDVTGQTVELERQVDQCDWIFVAHNSTNGRHLHLDRGSNSQSHPFELVAHQDAQQGNFIINTKYKKAVGNQAVQFEENQVFGDQIIIQTEVNSTTDKDFDNLEISISNINTDFELLKGWYYSGPNQLNANIITRLSTIDLIEVAIDQGVYPVLNIVSREFWKYHWNSQTTNNNCNVLNLAFKDGNKIIKHDAEDITNHNTIKYDTIILDNTKPYIAKCKIYAGSLTAEAGWRWVSQHQPGNEHKGYLEFFNNGIDVHTTNSPVTIEIEMSEGMENVDLNVNLIGDIDHSSYSSDRKTWFFQIGADDIFDIFQSGNSGEFDLNFDGTDVAGNELLHFTSTNNIQYSDIPLRNNDGTWSTKLKDNGYPKNSFYSFFIDANIPNPGVSANFSFNQTSNPPNAAVLFTDISSGEITSWSWSFPGGNPNSSSYNEPSVSYPSSGNYEATLIVEDGEGNQSIETKSIYVTEQSNTNIQINPSAWEWSDNEYEFNVQVAGMEPTDELEITAYFDDGGSATLDNNISFSHTYDEPNSPQIKHPYANVIVKNTYNSIIKNEIVYFGAISISPSFYNLNVDLTTKTYNANGEVKYGALNIEPNQEVEFISSVSNAAGQVYWYWFINKTTDDINKCYCNNSSCYCENNTSTSFSNNSNIYSFDEEGEYLIWIDVQDQYGHQGYKSLVINVQEAEDECIYSALMDICLKKYYLPLGIEKLYFKYYTSLYNMSYCDYDDIYSLEFLLNDVLTESITFECTGDFNGHIQEYCFEGFNGPGEYELKLKVQGAYKGDFDYELGCYPAEPSGQYQTEKINVEIVDCNAWTTIQSKDDLTAHSWNVNSGIVSLNPDDSIDVEDGESLHLEAWKKIKLKPGVHLKNGSYMHTKVKGCPEIPDWCSCWSKSEYTSNNVASVKQITYPTDEINVFPNPTNSVLNIKIPESVTLIALEILSIEGKNLYTKTNLREENILIDIASYKPGIYFLKLFTKDKIIVKKIIKQ